jgi:hypothetical protein
VSVLSQVTRKSTAALGLVPGKRVYVQAKSIALLARGFSTTKTRHVAGFSII